MLMRPNKPAKRILAKKITFPHKITNRPSCMKTNNKQEAQIQNQILVATTQTTAKAHGRPPS